MRQIRCECGCAFTVPAAAAGQARCPSCERLVGELPTDEGATAAPRGTARPTQPIDADAPTEAGLTLASSFPAPPASAADLPTEAGVTMPRSAGLQPYDFAEMAGTAGLAASDDATVPDSRQLGDDTFVTEPPCDTHWPDRESALSAETPRTQRRSSQAPAERVVAAEPLAWQFIHALDHIRYLIALLVIIWGLCLYMLNRYQVKMERMHGLAEYQAAVDEVRKVHRAALSFDAAQVAYDSYLHALELHRLGKLKEADGLLGALAVLYPQSEWGKKAANLLAGRPPE